MNVCPVCNYDKLSSPAYKNIAAFTKVAIESFMPPYEDKLGLPSYGVCPQCGYEFGNDDNPGTVPTGISFADYRSEWTASGSQWFSDSSK